MSSFVQDIWYFAGLSGDVKTGALIRRVIAGEPITLGRKRDGTVFALRDICPHRAAPLSEGRIISDARGNDAVECPYHGWKFGASDGVCQEIPALTADQQTDPNKIKVRHFPAREEGHLIWVYIAADKRFSGAPPIDPPAFPFANRKPIISDALTLNCHVDHAVIGLMDPAHGPYVHRQWWWRSEHSIHEKAKAFPTVLLISCSAANPLLKSVFACPAFAQKRLKLAKKRYYPLPLLRQLTTAAPKFARFFSRICGLSNVYRRLLNSGRVSFCAKMPAWSICSKWV